jgi:hypothetical protein
MARAAKKPKVDIDSFRLRMLFGAWYIFLYADNGETEIKKDGPFGWNIANQQVANYMNDGLTDLDRLKE